MADVAHLNEPSLRWPSGNLRVDLVRRACQVCKEAVVTGLQRVLGKGFIALQRYDNDDILIFLMLLHNRPRSKKWWAFNILATLSVSQDYIV